MRNMNHVNKRDNKPSVILNSIIEWFRSVFIPKGKSKEKDVTHNVAPRQQIRADSPSKAEQDKFIDEGGNSQPLK